jgi:hypothetical protein
MRQAKAADRQVRDSDSCVMAEGLVHVIAHPGDKSPHPDTPGPPPPPPARPRPRAAAPAGLPRPALRRQVLQEG